MTDMEDVGASVEADVGQRMKGFVSRFAANLIVSSVLPPPTPMRTSACAHSSRYAGDLFFAAFAVEPLHVQGNSGALAVLAQTLAPRGQKSVKQRYGVLSINSRMYSAGSQIHSVPEYISAANRTRGSGSFHCS